ncbi:hypothetical protein KPG66_10785 [Mycetohabitans sp. B2]|uniref:contractile injection system tape measure protein n=1 Tax=Mycetohabitans sp. B2 TaxID=2841274 RepID=UPI001EEED0C0|nr:contractile injection system tape measure protein [Mycetohabitans sp. B2]MCF7696557.1 hypothetical protein [Mycetohabitans sp. B2]
MRNQIDRLHFRLRASLNDAERLQRRCSLLFHDALRPHIARVIEQCDDGRLDEPYRVGRLVIDVGDIVLARFEPALLERTLVELARALRADLKAHASAGTRWAVLSEDKAAPWRATRSDTLRVATKTDTVSSDWAALLRYLDTGVWGAPDRAFDGPSGGPVPSPHACMMRLIQISQAHSRDDTSKARLLLAERCLQPSARHRLIAGCDGTALRALIAWLIAPTRIPLSRPLSLSGSQVASTTAIEGAQRHPIVARKPVSAQHLSHDATAAALSPDPLLEACLDALLAYPLTEPMRHMLRELLTAQFSKPNSARWLTHLTAELRERLAVALDLPDVRPTSPATASVSRVSSSARHAPWERDALTAERAMRGEQARVLTQRRPNPRVEIEPLIVANAGLVLLWPVLPRLFQTFELVDADNGWTPDAVRRAVALLDWLASGQTPPADWRLPVPRLLCGLPPLPDDVQPIDWPVLDGSQQEGADRWLNMTLAVLPGLRRLSAADVRAFFLQRTGMLVAGMKHLTLTVERDATDVLLSQVPWPLTQITLPWLSSPIEVEWLA